MFDDAFETFNHAGKVVKILYDPDPPNPRKEYDNFGTMLYRGTARMQFGDKGVTSEEIDETYSRKDVIALPVFAYVHSGVALNTVGFSCPWDSGQCEIIYVTHEDVKKEYSRKRITKALIKKVEGVLRSEVETYSDFCNGSVYGFVVEDENGKHLDSCWGFYGLDYCRDQAKESAKAVA